ncbi:Sc15 protein [Mycena sanguinolenta]|uniref:Sc15 protein n=1 Tax=Mycena sanguinolenta TaxID=230812 RepID=A0A8H6XH92_9AGAR|nr:Sc15 protein [Mycena sanguinolenta]
MFALRFVPLFLFATSFVTSAAVVEKRSTTADVEAIFNTLQSSIDSILPQITALTSAGTATDTTLTPLINDLITALNTATFSLGELTPVSLLGGLKKRQSEADIASLVAEIITNIVQALPAADSAIPGLDSLLSLVDAALVGVLQNLKELLGNFLDASKPHFQDLAGQLSSHGLGLTASLLGL